MKKHYIVILTVSILFVVINGMTWAASKEKSILPVLSLLLKENTQTNDNCPDDPDKLEPGICGCGIPDIDIDNDGYTTCENDCDDSNKNINPGIEENCDGIDNNCDNNIDEGFDLDKDGHTSCSGDCNDDNKDIFPGAFDIPDNGIDEDCSGSDSHIVQGAFPEGSLAAAYKELVPADADADSYDIDKFSLVTGLVQTVGNTPLYGVNVICKNHPEYGSAVTDFEGRFSLPVNGGGLLQFVYSKDGFITSHRKENVPIVDISSIETIVLLIEDSAETTLTFDGSADTVIIHQSSEVTDEFGSRTMTMVMKGDNRAFSVDASGADIQELQTITVRATEFTTPASMPAVLPPTSAFTYCSELSVDGVQRIRFEKPITIFVDNFLGFAVGGIVPVGYYDRDEGVWVPSDNGVVVRLLDTNTDGVIDALDATGNNLPDDLDGDGSYVNEVAGLLGDTSRYIAGATFWRALVSHFTPWDCNWPYGPPPGSTSPNPEGAARDNLLDPGTCAQRTYVNSYVEDQSRLFHEDIYIPGTDITLHYANNQVDDFKTVVSVPASGKTVPESLKKIIVKMELAGLVFQKELEPLAEQSVQFTWDGFDYLGRKSATSRIARISIGFEYDAFYYGGSNETQMAFAQLGGEVTGIEARQSIISWYNSELLVDAPGAIENSFADGWNLSNHHHLRSGSVLQKGDSTLIESQIGMMANIVAGNGVSESYMYQTHDGSLATDVPLRNIVDAVTDKWGNLYIAEYNSIRKVDPAGIITTVVDSARSNNYQHDYEDYQLGFPATEAIFDELTALAVDSEGNLYVADVGADRGYNRIVKIDSNGIVTLVAGSGECGRSYFHEEHGWYEELGCPDGGYSFYDL